LGDDVERFQVGKFAVVDDLKQVATTVEQPQDAVDLVGNFAQSFGQLAIVDLEHGLERRQLFEHAPPLVDPSHAFHEQALRRQLDGVAPAYGLEFDLELTVLPEQQAIHRILAQQSSE